MKTLSCLALAAFLVLSAPARADDAPVIGPVIGTVQEVEGTATVNGAPAAVGMPVRQNDLLETGADSRLMLLLIDDTELVLSRDGALRVDEYVFDETDVAANRATYSVLKGAFLYASGLIAKKAEPDVTVETPMGALGIRGTAFWGGEIDGGYGVLVTEGRVRFRNDAGERELGPGLGLQLKARGERPGVPKAWLDEKVKRAVATVTFRNPAAVRARIAQMKARHADLRARHRAFLKARKDIRRDRRGDENLERRERMKDIQKQYQERRRDLRLNGRGKP